MELQFWHDPETGLPHIFEHGVKESEVRASLPSSTKEPMTMKEGKKTKKAVAAQHLPRGWDEDKVRKIAAHYENQSEDEAVAEDEAAFETEDQTVMIVPTRFVPAIRRLLARRQRA